MHVSLSHQVVGTFREYERAATTELDAALSPLLAAYLRNLTDRAQDAGLPEPAVMQSSGGLASLEQAADHAALTVLSGPAGGAAGAAWAAHAAGEPDTLCFDMGGTSCDVCVVLDGEVREATRPRGRRPPRRAADARHPHRRRRRRLDRLARRRRRAAGRSAQRRRAPGPGRVRPRRRGADGHRREPPARACSAGSRAGSSSTARRRRRPCRTLGDALGLDQRETAEGIIRVANAEMVRALRVMTVERGVDPRKLALMAFGGAGGLHAAAIAEELGISKILCPRASGVLAALGLVVSERRRDAQRSVLLKAADLEDEPDELAERAREELGDPDADVRLVAELRYRGQAFELAVPLSDHLEEDFHTGARGSVRLP